VRPLAELPYNGSDPEAAASSRMKLATISVVLLGAALMACGRGDPQAELAAFVREGKAAAEARDWHFFADHIATSYVDAAGRRRDEMLGLIRGYFVTHPTVHVAARLETSEREGGDAARLVIVGGLLGTRGESLAAGAEGETYRLELELVRGEDSWQVIGARWDRTAGLVL
jgi:hypothetical protein